MPHITNAGGPSDNQKLGNPVDIEIGARIRERRTYLRLATGQFADMLQVSPERLAEFEQGLVPVTPSVLLRTAGMTCEPVQNLLDPNRDVREFRGQRSENRTLPANDLEQVLDEDSRELVKCYSRIVDASIREQVRQLVRRLACP